jgi:hypothetical protein
MTINLGPEIIAALLANLIVIIAGVVHLATRITEIHTDIKWIKKRCPQCQPISEENSK